MVFCSFCAKSQDQVFMLVAGPRVAICNECIKAAQAIVDQRLAEHAAEENSLPKQPWGANGHAH